MLDFEKNSSNLILFIGVFLISLLSFAFGFIVAEKRNREPIKIEQNYEEAKSSYCWSRDVRSLFSS